MLLPLVVMLSLAADPPGSNDTMKDLLKDAAQSGSMEKSDGGVPDGPDISRMPFTQESILKVVMYNQPKIQGCYEESLAEIKKKKVPEGTLKTSWRIDADGYVKKARVDKRHSTLKDPRLHDCVIAVLSTMQFPKPPDGKEHPIQFPFNLKAVR